MIGPPPGARVFLACGVTDMRRGMDSLAALVQQSLGADPFDGSLYAFRGRKGRLVKCLWHDGVGLCLLGNGARRGRTVTAAATSGNKGQNPNGGKLFEPSKHKTSF